MKLTFASYNIHKAVGLDRRRDPDRIISVLREIDADVIALQEADRRFGARASVLPKRALDDTPWKVVPLANRPRSIGWHGNAILVRRDMTIEGSRALDLPVMEPRGAGMALLSVNSHRLCVVGMHLDLSGLRRSDQLRTILAQAEKFAPYLPTVLLGDFNQWGTATGAMRIFNNRPAGWQPITPGRSFPSGRPIARLDRIVPDRHWLCVEAKVHHSSLAAVSSDHLPVVAKLELAR